MKSLPLFVLLSASLPSISQAAEKTRSPEDHEIVIGKELLITALEVVNAPEATYPGPWSFGHLMDEALGDKVSQKAVATWLEAWAKGLPESPTSTTGPPPREALEQRLIAPWRLRDGHVPGSGEWLPDFSHAPFRLLAIVNRMDLGEHALPTTPAATTGFPGSPGYNGGSGADSLAGREAGEARLVFAAVDPSGQPLPGGTTIILEYGLDAPSTARGRTRDWALAWHHLGTQPAFDDAYRADLVQVTRLFTDRRLGTRAPGEEPNSDVLKRLADAGAVLTPQLLRIRVNDGAFGEVREFREFHPASGKLVPARLPGTPEDSSFEKGSADNRSLAAWIAKQRVAPASQSENPRAAKTEIPPSFSFPGAGTTVARVLNNDPDFHWDGWGLRDGELRRAFSMQTCCGCHCGDTSTAFFHIAPASSESEATLSKFLRTDGSRWRPKDPANGRGFLSSEMEDRKKLLESVLDQTLGNRQLKQLREIRNGRFH
ncbi:hypothetical protein OKA05_26475 [Luteolibacter arcticus]|uniref:Cytochrome c domain-containing protein n=1 Tax=Luteolibacter arcticus TaxID=1581411 RepID=A0ABT3GRK6_9BACT|nr:hypothetical protein [Luteolibacter arcticus]MCW1926132.1 hypothetical protein [Luteolibacter arcticus]